MVKTIEFPKKWIPDNWKSHYDIQLLEVDGKCNVLKELLELLQKSKPDFVKLLATLKLQLESKSLLRNTNRLQRGKKDNQKGILEFKPQKGNARLFGFIDETEQKIIICTNTYWKTTGKSKKQDAAFEKAARLRIEYLDNQDGGK
jgi:hypothetical protein